MPLIRLAARFPDWAAPQRWEQPKLLKSPTRKFLNSLLNIGALRDVLLSQAEADKLFGEMKVKIRRVVEDDARPARQLSGEELTQLLRRLDAAQTEQERRHWLREYMRGFYGDNRGDSYA